MMLPATIKHLMSLDTRQLAIALREGGYTGCSFESAEFLGLTNGGEFCYKTTWFDEAGTGDNEVSKVFVKYNGGQITAEF